jgi:hypothetical protein
MRRCAFMFSCATLKTYRKVLPVRTYFRCDVQHFSSPICDVTRTVLTLQAVLSPLAPGIHICNVMFGSCTNQFKVPSTKYNRWTPLSSFQFTELIKLLSVFVCWFISKGFPHKIIYSLNVYMCHINRQFNNSKDHNTL